MICSAIQSGHSWRSSELDGLGALTSKDLDFYHNREAERALADSLENGLLEIPSGDNHTPNAAVGTGKLGNRDIVVDLLAQIKGVEDKALLENSIARAIVDETVILAPGDLGCVPVEVPYREAMMDADIGPLDTAEEAFDVVRVNPALRLVFLAVIGPVEFLQPPKVVVVPN